MDCKQVLKAFVRFCYEQQRKCSKFDEALRELGLVVNEQNGLAREILYDLDYALESVTRHDVFISNEYFEDFHDEDGNFETFWHRYYESEFI